MGREILELEIRRKIYDLILKSPGLHVRELARELNIALSTLDYHLHYLYKRGLVAAKSDGRYTRCYIAGKISVKDKKIISVLRRNVPRKILLFLLSHPSSFHRAICIQLQLAPSTISFHLNKLLDLDIVDRIKAGRETRYQIKEPEYVSNLLIAYRETFLDKAVDRFSDTWLELHPRHLHKPAKRKI